MRATRRPKVTVYGVLAACAWAASDGAIAQEPVRIPPIEVIGVAPLPGLGTPVEQVPSNVQSFGAAELARQRTGGVAEFLNFNANSTSLGSPTGNAFQPDVSFRGFTASALLGTPQGLSVFQDGVRINEAFADVVNWDLLPKNAVASMQLLPGSNPIFGLNTLGGALTIQMKDGFRYSGLDASVSAGSFGRIEVSADRGLSRRRPRRLRGVRVDRRRRLARPLEHAHPAPLHPARRPHGPGSGESGGQPRRQLYGRHAGATDLDARQPSAAVHVARHHGEPPRLRQRQRTACVRRRYATRGQRLLPAAPNRRRQQQRQRRLRAARRPVRGGQRRHQRDDSSVGRVAPGHGPARVVGGATSADRRLRVRRRQHRFRSELAAGEFSSTIAKRSASVRSRRKRR